MFFQVMYKFHAVQDRAFLAGAIVAHLPRVGRLLLGPQDFACARKRQRKGRSQP